MPNGWARSPYVRHSRPSASFRRCGGLPSPVSVTSSLSSDQEAQLSAEVQASIQLRGFSLSSARRTVVTRSRGESRTVDGMMAYPFGSGPIDETNCQLLAPSVVRSQIGRPSLPLLFEAV